METKRRVKRANGTGSIKKLSGNRKNPFAVFPPVTEYDHKGMPITPKAIGYYSCYTTAVKELNKYMKERKKVTIELSEESIQSREMKRASKTSQLKA